MIGSSRQRIVQSIIDMIDSNEFNMNHKLQREPGQWNKGAASLLIDSILRGININTIYTIVEKIKSGDSSIARYAIIDGIQRSTTINDFIKGKFRLTKDLEMVDGEEIAGKAFKELSEKLQKRILNYEITFFDITDYTEQEVREMYRRQNNGKQLNKKQLRPIYESDEVLSVVFRLSTHELITGSEIAGEDNSNNDNNNNDNSNEKQKAWQGLVSNTQIKNAVNRDIIIETLMLMFSGSKDDKYKLDFTDKNINNFISNFLNDNIEAEEERIKTLEEAMNKLYLTLKDNESVKINISSLPMVLYGAYKTLSSKKSFSKYCENVMKFIAEYDENEEYKKLCEKHTTSEENVKGRLNYFKTKIIPS